jgi:hypothetical protein
MDGNGSRCVDGGGSGFEVGGSGMRADVQISMVRCGFFYLHINVSAEICTGNLHRPTLSARIGRPGASKFVFFKAFFIEKVNMTAVAENN